MKNGFCFYFCKIVFKMPKTSQILSKVLEFQSEITSDLKIPINHSSLDDTLIRMSVCYFLVFIADKFFIDICVSFIAIKRPIYE